MNLVFITLFCNVHIFYLNIGDNWNNNRILRITHLFTGTSSSSVYLYENLHGYRKKIKLPYLFPKYKLISYCCTFKKKNGAYHNRL